MRPTTFKGIKKKVKAKLSIGDEEVECQKRTKPLYFNVPSESRPDQEYEVRYTKVGAEYQWGCNCKAFAFKKIGVVDCKHIRFVKDKVCRWKSSAGPERQFKRGICPRCGGLTQVVEKEDEDV